MEKSVELPFLHVSGTNFEVGYQIGTYFRQIIQQTFSTDKRINQLLHWDKTQPNRVTEAEKLTRQYFPHYLEEIRGIAQGADLPYRDVLTVNFMHLPPLEQGVQDDCSTVMVCEKDHIIIGHNEDHEIGLGQAAYLVQCSYSEPKVTIFSFLYPGCIPGLSFGFNNHGLVVTCNYAPDPNLDIGIPRLILGRWVLESRSLTEAINRAQAHSQRAGGVTYNMAFVEAKSGVVLETTGKEGNVRMVANERFFHTNHYLATQFSHIPILSPSKSSTLKRYTRGMELLRDVPNSISDSNSVSDSISNSDLVSDSVSKSDSVETVLSLMQDPGIFLEPFTFPSGDTFYSICTAIFEIGIGKGVSLKIYNRGKYRETPFSIYLADLQSTSEKKH
ncbi:MAG: C45 family autoproteolytic acyltransferase/hydrolase [Promethearchaeota archaeon]